MVRKMTLSALYRAHKTAEAAWRAAQSKACAGRVHGDVVEDPDARMTVFIGTTRKADIGTAKEILSPAKFRAITETVISLSRLDDALKAGKISQTEYDAIVSSKDNAPYLKVTLH